MKNRLRIIFKKSIIAMLLLASLSTAVYSSIPVAQASGSYDILGTNAALGSPILNNNFTLDNWNKWEMICWGVYLSNFCQPLIDTYESAFQNTGSGSNGAGYKALCFGSGSDTSNNETIEELTNYAVLQSSTVSKDIVVTYTPIKDGRLGDKPDPNSTPESFRPAKFKDFFFDIEEDNSATAVVGNTWASEDSFFNMSIEYVRGYTDVHRVKKGMIPTFYVKTSSGYKVLFDYTDPWDIQMASAIINAVRRNETSENEFKTAFEENWNTNPEVYMDAFANILCDSKMLIPSSINQHITKNNSINLINSWVFNDYSSTYSTNQLLNGLQQTIRKSGLINIVSSPSGTGGFPAFGKSEIGAIGLLYYDLDTIAVQDYSGKEINYGEALTKLFDSDISKKNNKYTLKFEVANDAVMKFKINGATGDPLDNTNIVSSLMSNILQNTSGVQPETLSYILDQKGNKISLFSSTPVVIANQKILPSEDKSRKSGKASRHLYNFIYQAYKGNVNETSAGKFSAQSAVDILKKSTTTNVLADELEKGAWKQFKSWDKDLKPEDVEIFPGNKWIVDAGANELIDGVVVENGQSVYSNRAVLVYPISDTIRSISQILGVKEGTEFSLYSTMIYMTYLDWYGVVNQTTINSGSNKTSNFDPELFDESSDVLNIDPSSLVKLKSEEELENEVLQMSYLMLHPEDGRSYRKTLMYNGMTDWMYEQYNRIVYGGSDSVYSGSASKSNSGFLAIETYADNWLTKWFLEGYTDIAVWIIMICCVLVIIIGLLKTRKLSWYLISLITVVNVVLLVPSSGELVPYITSSFVQSMFSSKMTYWAISEGTANASLESDTASQTKDFDNVSKEDAELIVSLIKQLNVVYTDRSLMLKQDTSQKLTQKTSGVYTEIQSIQSARWILPMVMQQFTGDNETKDYLYVSLSNVWDDMSNLYWYFNPLDAENINMVSPTATSGQTQGTNGDNVTVADETQKYNQKTARIGDANTSKDNITEFNDNVHYKCYSYTLHSNPEENVHLYSYILPTTGARTMNRKTVFGQKAENYENVDSWQKYIDTAISQTSSSEWNTTTNGIEDQASSYDRSDRSTLKPYHNYLRSTESPSYYFYNVVKDTFEIDKTVGTLIGRLQGTIEKDEEGKEVRNNFMHATKSVGAENLNDSSTVYTGWIRDIVDLEEMFYNIIPYMYEMQLIAGGFDGNSGILVEKTTDSDGNISSIPMKISDKSQYYSGMNQSWYYRCNWATKIMENPDYSKACTVRDSTGTKYNITNPLLVESYPESRPMIFSEAQMKAYGLYEGDLNLVELKCLEVNKQIARNWTLLINYAGTAGVTKEVLMREMGIIATQIFCTEFSSSSVINTKYSLYPQSIDLRYLSFDSVMKMLMMNVSKNTQYVYGDTMSTVLESSDGFTAALLLLSAFLCAYIVPLCRTILMAMIFYLGFIAIIRALFSDNKYKSKVACGQLVSNMLFMVYTLIFYGVFAALMAVTSRDEVLSVSSVQASAGNPVWVLIATILASSVYIYLMGRQINFCFAHFRDMGFEVYSTVASAVTGRISDAINNMQDKMSNVFNGGDTNTTYQSSNTNSMKGTGARNSQYQEMYTSQSSSNNINIDSLNDKDTEYNEDMFASPYTATDTVDYVDNISASDIDAEIEAGKQMEDI